MCKLRCSLVHRRLPRHPHGARMNNALAWPMAMSPGLVASLEFAKTSAGIIFLLKPSLAPQGALTGAPMIPSSKGSRTLTTISTTNFRRPSKVTKKSSSRHNPPTASNFPAFESHEKTSPTMDTHLTAYAAWTSILDSTKHEAITHRLADDASTKLCGSAKRPNLCDGLIKLPSDTNKHNSTHRKNATNNAADLVVLDAETEFDDVVAMLVDCGVEPVDANRYITSVVMNSDSGTFGEVYGKSKLGNAVRREKDMNLVGLRALDLRFTRPDGEHSDSTRKSVRKCEMCFVDEDCPMWIIGTPPCTACSSLNVGLDYQTMAPDDVEKKWNDGMIHKHFIC